MTGDRMTKPLTDAELTNIEYEFKLGQWMQAPTILHAVAELRDLRAEHAGCAEVLESVTKWGNSWKDEYQEAFTKLAELRLQNDGPTTDEWMAMLRELRDENAKLVVALETIRDGTCCDESEMFADDALASVRGES